jgi:hypothetical protein
LGQFLISQNNKSIPASEKFLYLTSLGSKSSEIRLPTDLMICNPSIISKNGHFKAIVRGLLPFNYKTANENTPTSENWIVEFDTNLQLLSQKKIEDLHLRESIPAAYLGLEDGRLFVWKGQEWVLFSGFSKDLGDARNSMVLCRLEEDQLKDPELLKSPFRHPREKNWMPCVIEDELYFVYSSAPLEVFHYLGAGKLQRISLNRPSPAARWLRRIRPKSIMSGSSQLIPWGNDFLAVIHYREQMDSMRRLWMKFVSRDKDYQVKKVLFRHRFVLFGKDLSIKMVSSPFQFEIDGVEFCAGMAEKGGEIYLSYGLLDRQAKILKIDVRVIRQKLNFPLRDLPHFGY